MVDVQAWLMRARGINAEIDAIDELIALAESRAKGSRSAGSGGGGHSNGGLENYVARVETYNTQRAKLERIRDEVYDAILTLSDTRHQAALIRYYITGQTWQSIADGLGVDRKTIGRWHAFAKAELRKNFFECPTMSHDALASHMDNEYDYNIGIRGRAETPSEP